jgi:hypothetical protein
LRVARRRVPFIGSRMIPNGFYAIAGHARGHI